MNAVPCIKCGRSGCVVVNLEDADLSCNECQETYGLDDVRQVIAGWVRLTDWLAAHPNRETEPAAVKLAK